MTPLRAMTVDTLFPVNVYYYLSHKIFESSAGPLIETSAIEVRIMTQHAMDGVE